MRLLYKVYLILYCAYVDVDNDDCRRSPCRNGGTCEDGIGIGWCRCDDGYAGKRCELGKDDVASKVCIKTDTQTLWVLILVL